MRKYENINLCKALCPIPTLILTKEEGKKTCKLCCDNGCIPRKLWGDCYRSNQSFGGLKWKKQVLV